jgi:hypothetical protein
LISGCATLDQSQPTVLLKGLQNVSLGMSRQEVSQILGNTITVGYEVTDETSATVKPITKTNPLRTETIRKNDQSFEVDFYLTHIRQADGTITDDELTPFIFEEGKLVGISWYDLKKIRSQ